MNIAGFEIATFIVGWAFGAGTVLLIQGIARLDKAVRQWNSASVLEQRRQAYELQREFDTRPKALEKSNDQIEVKSRPLHTWWKIYGKERRTDA